MAPKRGAPEQEQAPANRLRTRVAGLFLNNALSATSFGSDFGEPGEAIPNLITLALRVNCGGGESAILNFLKMR